MDNSTAAVAAAHRIDVSRWLVAFGAVADLLEPRFGRYEPLRHAVALVTGLLSPLERKNCWTIAEARGYADPHRLQHLLSRAKWDTDAVRDDVRGYVVNAFADDQAVLVVDETGDLKKGVESVGAARQYTGTAGRIENAQVAVYLTYAAPRGHALIDRALYLPEAWAGDPGRLQRAGVPEGVEFATKPALATGMITRAVAAGTPARWVAGDEVYGADPKLRAAARTLGLGYVLQVASNRRVRTAAGLLRVDAVPPLLPASAWQTYSCGQGAKGHRDYQWAWAAIRPDTADTDPENLTGQHHLLIRRTRSTGELAYLRAWTPHRTTLAELARVAGQRWRTEESFQQAKQLTGLDQHQVRRWSSWHRWTTLAMLAYAFLAVAAAIERDHTPTPTPTPTGMIELTVNEYRHLFTTLTLDQRPSLHQLLSWSNWRRRHQAKARASHYRRQQTQ